MTGVQKDDPYNEFVEEVRIGTTCRSAAVTLIFDSRSGDFNARNGRIINKTPQRINRSTPTTLTVESNGGSTYVVSRHPRGDYKAETMWTWVDRVQ